MAAQHGADTTPDARASRASPRPGGRRRPAVRRVVHGVLFVALAAGVFGLLPRLGGLTRDAAGLRHARPAFVVAAVVAQAASLGCYAQLYRRVLAALGAELRFRLAADVVLASFSSATSPRSGRRRHPGEREHAGGQRHRGDHDRRGHRPDQPDVNGRPDRPVQDGIRGDSRAARLPAVPYHRGCRALPGRDGASRRPRSRARTPPSPGARALGGERGGASGPASILSRRRRPAADSRRWPGRRCPGGPSWPASDSPRRTCSSTCSGSI
jgi:hypothetical protein